VRKTLCVHFFLEQRRRPIQYRCTRDKGRHFAASLIRELVFNFKSINAGTDGLFEFRKIGKNENRQQPFQKQYAYSRSL